MRELKLIALVAFMLLVMTTMARAVTIYDPNIFVAQSSASTSGEPNLITNVSGFQVGWIGSHIGTNPLLIVVGVPNGGAAPTLSWGGNLYSPGGTAAYGWNGSAQAVSFSASDGSTDAYTKLGITYVGGGSSEMFSNWIDGQTDSGLTASTSFNLYAYELPFGLTSNVTLDLQGTVTLGSYVVAYDQIAMSNAVGVGATPFTTSGLASNVPEPASLLLIGVGLCVIAGLKRKLETC